MTAGEAYLRCDSCERTFGIDLVLLDCPHCGGRLKAVVEVERDVASLGETRQPEGWETRMDEMKPPGTRIDFTDDGPMPLLTPEKQRENALAIIRRSMAHDHVEAWGPE